MQLGKSLVGALVGGALGIGVLIGIYMLTGWDKAWLAIPVAVITGLGVRSTAATTGHASYARGALTALIAILAFLAWYPIQAQITVRGSVAQPIVADRATAEAKTANADDATEPSLEVPRADAGRNLALDAFPKPRAQPYSTWEFLWLSIAGLIAYELGRGTAATATGAMGSPADGPPPVRAGQTAAPPK